MRSIAALALALLAMSPRATAFAQLPPSYVGQQIIDVQLVREGQPLDDPAVDWARRDACGPAAVDGPGPRIHHHIFGLGRFQDVQVEALPTPGGVLLRYRLVPLHSVQRVDFRGLPSLGLSEGLLRSHVTNRFGTSPPVGRAQEAARTIEQLYHDHGYLRATVNAVATELHDPDRTLLEFEITPGPRAVIGAAEVEGQPAEGAAAFLRQIHAAPSQPYEPTAITDELAKYVQKLRRRSRYEAAASYRARPSADGSAVDLTVTLANRSRRDRRVRRRSASEGQARRARADRARSARSTKT